MIRAPLRLFLPLLLGFGLATGAAAQQQQPKPGSPAAPKPGQARGQAAPAKPGAKPASGQAGQPGGANPAATVPGGGQAVQAYADWSVYRTAANPKVCYALTTAKSRSPSSLKDIQGYMFVSARPSERVRNEISLIMNFALKETAEHQLAVGRDQFVLSAKGQNLWVKNPAEEGRIVEAMKRANDLTVKGVSAKNNATADKYSLKGFGDAIERMQKECR